MKLCRKNHNDIGQTGEKAFKKAVLEGLGEVNSGKTIPLNLVKSKLKMNEMIVMRKTNPNEIYRWAEVLAQKKGFAHLKEEDIVRLTKKYGGSLIRKGWSKAFKKMAQYGDDKLLD